MSEDERIENAIARITDRRAAGESASIEEMLSENPDIEGPLRARFRVARMIDGFGSPPDAGSGVLATLSSAGSRVCPLSLPEPIDDDPSPVTLSQAPAGRWGRYTVHGQIARGGVGVVLKARDPDLGRDVALKTLRHEHTKSPDVLQRFVEEAQIGGQLQHPGIVPVHEFGMSSDGQPYFAMRLVKGKTLASLLAARESPSADGPRFLSVFHAVCQTVAYAHQRGIMHRDLKPSNVMVGAFGEVQVLDWGMAKVLASGGAADDARSSHAEDDEDPPTVVRTVRSASGSAPSVEGSIIGTPQYMAPEQARGQTSAIDERADVFSLGAILCEILTAKGPYSGKRIEDVLQAAIRGDLRAAHERLRKSDADPALVALAVRCLAPAREDRPKEASVVAREVTNHLASLDRRARKAEVDAAEARVRVEQERRARKLTLALSASVVSLVLLGGGGWLWRSSERQAREESTARDVAAALDEANRLQAKAQALGGDVSLPVWRDAAAAARRAQAVATTGEADSATRELAAAAASSIEGAWKRVEEASERQRHDDSLVERISQIAEIGERTLDWTSTSTSYAAVFAEILGGEVESLGVSEASRRFSASSIRERLIRPLWYWSLAALRAGEDTKLLGDLLAQVDSNPWRTRLRSAGEDIDRLRSIAESTPVDALSDDDLLDFAQAVGMAGDPERAATLAGDAWHRHPDDYRASVSAAYWSHECRPPRVQDARRYRSAALSAAPRSAWARLALGNASAEDRDFDSASRELREAVRLAPTIALAHSSLGQVLDARGEHDTALAEHRQATRLAPDSASYRVGLASCLDSLGNFDEAEREYREAIRLAPRLGAAHLSLGGFLMERGDDAAVAELREAVRLDPRSAAAHGALGEFLAMRGDLEEALRESNEAVRLDPSCVQAHIGLGRTLASRGESVAAIAEYREAIRLEPTCPSAHERLGLLLYGLGDPDGAILEYSEAIRGAPKAASAHAHLGAALADKREFERALAECREAIRIDPKRSSLHVTLAGVFEDEGDLDQAILACRDAIRLNPVDVRAHSRLGNLLEKKGEVEESVSECREAIRLDPKNADAHRNLGRAQAHLGETDNAIAEYRESIRLYAARWTSSRNWNLAIAHSNLGVLLGGKREFEAALAECREAIQLKPNEADFHMHLSWVLGDAKDTDEAIRECREAIRLNPTRAWARATLGMLLRLKGDVEGAVSACHEALHLKPDDAFSHVQLGQALVSRGDDDGAITAFREAARLDPRVAEPHRGLATTLARAGRTKDAVDAYRDTVRLGPKYAADHIGLSVCLDRNGDPDGAAKEARAAAAIDPEMRDAERLLALAFRGEAPPTSRDALALARICYHGALFVASTRAWERAFALEPKLMDDLQACNLYDAACAAALAATGRGLDSLTSDALTRSGFRQLALKWLRADLGAWKTSSDAKERRRHLEWSKADPDLAGLRGGPDIEKAPTADREACRALWAEVDAMLATPAPPR